MSLHFCFWIILKITVISSAQPEAIRSLIAAFRAGDRQAGNQLMEVFYPELKRLAARQMQGEKAGHSWQPTLLVNELYLQLVRVKALEPADSATNDRGAFFALAGQIMRRLLIHHARPLAAKAEKIQLADDLVGTSDKQLLETEELLARLEAIKPALRQVVELKVFEGLTAEEIASRLGCSAVSVHRYWHFSRHWLANELSSR
jgi:RNA polymerase sigma factor (TIGR02999 family)